MEFLSLFLYLCFTVPMFVVIVLTKDKAKSLICFIVVGITIALICGELNGIIKNNVPYSINSYSTTFSPIIEEILKAIPVFIFAFGFKPNRQELIEKSICVGVGFAILENAFVFASSGWKIDVWNVILRSFGSGMMHVIASLFIGFGLSFIIAKPRLYLPGSAGLIALAISFHSIYNYLVVCDYYLLGLLMPSLVFIPATIFIKKFQKV